MQTSPRATLGSWALRFTCLCGKRAEKNPLYFVMNTIYGVISFMQTSEDESKNLYKL